MIRAGAVGSSNRRFDGEDLALLVQRLQNAGAAAEPDGVLLRRDQGQIAAPGVLQKIGRIVLAEDMMIGEGAGLDQFGPASAQRVVELLRNPDPGIGEALPAGQRPGSSGRMTAR